MKLQRIDPLLNSSSQRRKTAVWWDAESSLVVQQSRETLNKFNSNINIQYYIKARNRIAISKKILKAKRQEL